MRHMPVCAASWECGRTCKGSTGRSVRSRGPQTIGYTLERSLHGIGDMRRIGLLITSLPLLALACQDPAGPPDDFEPDSFSIELGGAAEVRVEGLARFTRDVTVSIDGGIPVEADLLELVVAPPRAGLELSLNVDFLGETPARKGHFTVTGLDTDGGLPAEGVVAFLSLDLLDGTVGTFVSETGTVSVLGLREGEIWGVLNLFFGGITTTDGVPQDGNVSVAGEFRADVR